MTRLPRHGPLSTGASGSLGQACAVAAARGVASTLQAERRSGCEQHLVADSPGAWPLGSCEEARAIMTSRQAREGCRGSLWEA